MSQNAADECAGGAEPELAPKAAGGRMRAFFTSVLARIDQIKRRALAALAVRVVGAGLVYLMQILLAQWLGLAQYGVFVAVWVWLLVLGGVASLGLNVAVIGHVATFLERADRRRWRAILVTAVATTLATGTLIAAAGLLLVHEMPGLFAEAYLLPVWLCLFCVPLFALGEVNEGIARAHGWMLTALSPTYLLRPTLLIACCFMAIQAGYTLDATLAMAMAIAAALLTNAIQSAVLLFRLARVSGLTDTSDRLQPREPARWMILALPIVVAQTFELVTQNADMIAVSYFLGPEATGLYFAALKTIALLAFVNFAVGAATANRIAGLDAAGDREAFEDQVQGAVNLVFWPTLIGAAVLIAASPLLLSLFGRDFSAHAYLTVILAVGFVAKGFVGPAELFLNVLGHQRTCALVLMVAALLNVALNATLIPWLGLPGAAIATSASFVVLAAALYLIGRRRLGISLRPTVPWTTIARLFPRLSPAGASR